MPFELPILPYALTALEPHMSARTLEFHYGKHHKGYVDNLNKLITETGYENTDLVSTIKSSFVEVTKKHKDEPFNKQTVSIFRSAAQVWNHTFFWDSMKQQGGGAPTGKLATLIDQSFGDLAGFKAKFKEKALKRFGSGWVWLVLTADGKLEVTHTPNALCPMVFGQKALLTCDLWEHAYYLDYQNRRADMVQAFLDHLVNWDFAAKNLG
jgi:Fe-Mn family superoxide dismutase